MEGSTVQNELIMFGASVIFGSLCGIVFDFFRSFRKKIAGSGISTAIQDILFWTLITGMFFALVYIYNYGQLRLYIFLGAVIGVIMYMLILSRIMIWCFTGIIECICKVFMLIIGVLVFPIKIIAVPLAKINKKIGAVLVKTKKNIKNTKKQLKMY